MKMKDLESIDIKSLQSIQAPLITRSLSYISLTVSAIAILALFLPWRQTVTGQGKVTVFSPMQRPQSINSQIDARIKKWHVTEGQYVSKGDLLLELDEVKPKYLDKNQLPRLQGQQGALSDKKVATESLIKTLEKQIISYTDLQNAAVPNAELKIKQSSDKLRASQQKYLAAEQNFKTASLNFDRRKQLFDKGLSSKRDFELAEQKFIKTQSELEAANAELDIAKRDIQIAKLDFSKVSAEATLKIQEAEAKLAQSFEKLAGISSDIYKLDITTANFESRILQRKIYAPVDGQVVRLRALGQAEIIKAGKELAVIAPITTDQAVELFISDMFIPLVSIDREVRLQFSGFPGLQLGGFPSVAIGTFAGTVSAIDASSNKNGMYRILVKPDVHAVEAHKDVKWPDPVNLRPGTKTLGWIILDEVPVWYELWRVLNGFPPTILESAKQKLPKLK